MRHTLIPTINLGRDRILLIPTLRPLARRPETESKDGEEDEEGEESRRRPKIGPTRSTFFDPATPTPAGRSVGPRRSVSSGRPRDDLKPPTAYGSGDLGKRLKSVTQSHEDGTRTSSARSELEEDFPVGTCIGHPEVSEPLNDNLSSYLHVWRGNLKAVSHCVVMVLSFDAIQVKLKKKNTFI